jgi:hypothetical protein
LTVAGQPLGIERRNLAFTGERNNPRLFWSYKTFDSGLHYVESSLIPIVVPKARAHRSSMLQDIEAGRKPEIDYLNGAVLKMGRSCGIGKRFLLRFKFKEKGGKEKELPVHHKLEEILEQYLKATGLEKEPESPLFPVSI